MTQNQIAFYNAQENKRHNQMVENEAMRSNMAKEGNERRGQDISREHYVRSDLETARSNRAQEQLKETAIGVDYAKLAETHRSNVAQEQIGRTNASANMTNAISNRIKANSGAYLDYSTAALRHAETGLKDLEASYTVARTNLTEQQYATEIANTQNAIANVGLTKAKRENTQMQTELMPVTVWSQAVSNTARLGTYLGGTK